MIERDNSQPIYVQIQNILENMLKEGQLKPGDAVPSENEFADTLHVSRLTVRKAYSELVRQGLFYTVQGKGTFVSEEYRKEKIDKSIDNGDKTNKVLGVIFPEVTNFFSKVLKAIEEKATEKKYVLNIMFNDSYERETQAVNNMLENRVDGIIMTPFRSNGEYKVDNYQKIMDANIPFVMIGKPPFKVQCDAIICDDVVGAYEAVEYLIKKGHKRIIHITDSLLDAEALAERKEGYLRAMRDYLPNEQINIVDVRNSEWINSLMGLVNSNKPTTGIFCVADELYAMVFNMLSFGNKKVPEDIEIIGYDNSNICETFSVGLSSVDQPKFEAGYLAYSLLEEKLYSEQNVIGTYYNKHVIMKPKLILRKSTGADKR
jgi:DNA-binding LacI/PurR family transcriptional regulator